MGNTDPDVQAMQALTSQSGGTADPDVQAMEALTKPQGTTPDLATTQAIQSGADPVDLAKAKKQLGDQDYIGYCQSFVENVTGSGWKGSSAIDAWSNAQNKVQSLEGIKPGDEIYWSPNDSNEGNGHVGIYAGNGTMISATDNGIQQTGLTQWVQETGQQPLGYIPIGAN